MAAIDEAVVKKERESGLGNIRSQIRGIVMAGPASEGDATPDH